MSPGWPLDAITFDKELSNLEISLLKTEYHFVNITKQFIC
jgi:hypothetical protein